MSTVEQKELNEKHANKPEIGDYWNEMFCGICVVLKIIENNILICKSKKYAGQDRWTWDLDKTELMGKDDFKKWISYSHIDGYWCDVLPSHMMWAANHVTFNKIKEQPFY